MRTVIGRARIEVALGAIFVIGFIVDVVRGLSRTQFLIGVPFFVLACAVLTHGASTLRGQQPPR